MSESEGDNSKSSGSSYYRNLEILLEEQSEVIDELKEEIDKLNYQIEKMRMKIKSDITEIIDGLYSIIP